MLPGVRAGGVAQGTKVHTGGPVRQEEAWLRAGQAVGGPGTKTLLPGRGGNPSYIESTKRRHYKKFSGEVFFAQGIEPLGRVVERIAKHVSNSWNEMSTNTSMFV